MKGPTRPRGTPVLRHARHGAWVLEVHYRGSSIRDVFEMFVDESKAREALQFLQLVHTDDQLHGLDGEGDAIATEHFRAGWAEAADGIEAAEAAADAEDET